MKLLENKEKEILAIYLLRKYGRLLLSSGKNKHQKQKRKLLKEIKKISMELIDENI